MDINTSLYQTVNTKIDFVLMSPLN